MEKSGTIYINRLPMKIKAGVAITALIALIGVLLIFKLTSCSRLSCIALLDQEKYILKESYEENKYIFRALYEKDDGLLRIEAKPSTLDEANQAIKTQEVKTKGLFEPAAAPYPGEISYVITCNDEYKPTYSEKSQNGIHISYFEGYINDRFVFGSCTDDQAKYHDTLTMFYCPSQKKFYKVEIIIPRTKYLQDKKKNEAILSSLGCK